MGWQEGACEKDQATEAGGTLVGTWAVTLPHCVALSELFGLSGPQKRKGHAVHSWGFSGIFFVKGPAPKQTLHPVFPSWRSRFSGQGTA